MKQNKSQVIIVIVLFAVLFFLAVSAGFFVSSERSKGSSVTIKIEDVSNKILAHSSNEQHVVDAEITLVFTGKNNGKIDMDKADSIVRNVMTEIDFDKCTQDDGVEYIKSEIINQLKYILPDETTQEIYFTMLIFDDPFSDGTGHKAPN